jgi:hypothetical protein
VAIASTDLAMAQFLASLITMLTDYAPSTYVIFAIYLGIIILHGIVNSLAVRLNGIFNIISGNYPTLFFFYFFDNYLYMGLWRIFKLFIDAGGTQETSCQTLT